MPASIALGDLCEIQSGGTPKRTNPEYWDGDVPWVKITDMRNSTISITEERISEAGLKGSSAKLLPKGTLLLSIFATIGRTATLGIDAATNQAIAGLRIRDRDQVDLKYLRQYLDFVAPKLASQGRGVAQANINLSILRKTQIPLPPLPEQRRIAEILDKADALRAKRRVAIAKCDQLLQSVFLDMFGDPVANTKGWPTATLANLGRILTGSTPPSKLEGMFGGAIPFVTPGDLGTIIAGSRRTVTEDGAEKSRTVEADCTLVCCIGATIGKMGKTTEKTAFNQQINAVSWDPAVIVGEFGFRMMLFFAHEVAAKGASTTLPILKKSEFTKLNVPVPPIELQRRFATQSMRLQYQRTRSSQMLESLDTFFACLQAQAFSGRLSEAA